MKRSLFLTFLLTCLVAVVAGRSGLCGEEAREVRPAAVASAVSSDHPLRKAVGLLGTTWQGPQQCTTRTPRLTNNSSRTTWRSNGRDLAVRCVAASALCHFSPSAAARATARSGAARRRYYVITLRRLLL